MRPPVRTEVTTTAMRRGRSLMPAWTAGSPFISLKWGAGGGGLFSPLSGEKGEGILTEVIYQREERGPETKRKHHRQQDIPISKQPRRQRPVVPLPHLNRHKNPTHHSRTNKQSNNRRAIPPVFSPSPLQREQQHNNRR